MNAEDRISQLRLRLKEAQEQEARLHQQYMQAAAYVCRIREQLEDLLTMAKEGGDA